MADAENGSVVTTLFEADGTLGGSASAHMDDNGAFVLDLTMITGFDRTETRMVLWTAPNTESGKGGYARWVPRSRACLLLRGRSPEGVSYMAATLLRRRARRNLRLSEGDWLQHTSGERGCAGWRRSPRESRWGAVSP